MRSTLLLAAGAVVLVLGVGSASSAPGFATGIAPGGNAMKQVRAGHRPHVRRVGRRVMGLPTPGARGTRQRLRLPRV